MKTLFVSALLLAALTAVASAESNAPRPRRLRSRRSIFGLGVQGGGLRVFSGGPYSTAAIEWTAVCSRTPKSLPVAAVATAITSRRASVSRDAVACGANEFAGSRVSMLVTNTTTSSMSRGRTATAIPTSQRHMTSSRSPAWLRARRADQAAHIAGAADVPGSRATRR